MQNEPDHEGLSIPFYNICMQFKDLLGHLRPAFVSEGVKSWVQAFLVLLGCSPLLGGGSLFSCFSAK